MRATHAIVPALACVVATRGGQRSGQGVGFRSYMAAAGTSAEAQWVVVPHAETHVYEWAPVAVPAIT